MALKKSDLYASLWSACDEIGRGIEPSLYKNYVLMVLFLKYISDKYVGDKYAPITVPVGSSFADLVALKGSPNIGEQINTKIMAPLAAVNKLTDMPDFSDPTIFGDGDEMVTRLGGLISVFQDARLDFSKNRAEGDDILGDAYEYFMLKFATASGKSKGQFYTPAEASRLLAMVVGINSPSTTNETTVYDPTCGSGSLLLKVAAAAKDYNGSTVSLYGQEYEAANVSLARMNTVLHGCPTAEIVQGNTITDPKFLTPQGGLRTFDFVLANPPFSDKRWSSGLTADNHYGRFDYLGMPPARQGDYAYLEHIIASMSPSGRGAVILPHGVLFRGNAETIIRRNIIERGYIKAIIGLPSNLFFGTGIPACVLVLDKPGASRRQGIFMINASKGFTKDGSKNRLREQDIHRIHDVYTNDLEVPGYSRMVPLTEITDSQNNYNLNIPRYIDSVEPEDIQDLAGHIHGGVPLRDVDLLDSYWRVMPGLRDALFTPAQFEGYFDLRVAAEDVRATIEAHPEYQAFRSQVASTFNGWRTTNEARLRSLAPDDNPKYLIAELSESILEAFEDVGLFDPYDLYQSLMEYWAETMQDDVYMVALDGWAGAALPQEIFQQKDKNGKAVWPSEADFFDGKRRFRSELVPAMLIIDEYLERENTALGALADSLAAVEQIIEDEKNEHAVEGGLLEDAVEIDDDSKVKVSLKYLNQWLKENGTDPEVADEIVVVTRLRDLLVHQNEIKATMKEASTALNLSIAEQYSALDESAIQSLVIEAKWLWRIEHAVSSSLEGVAQTLESRVSALGERYSYSLSFWEESVQGLSNQVTTHLTALGAV
jgi:type I restriction enzyme M protein